MTATMSVYLCFPGSFSSLIGGANPRTIGRGGAAAITACLKNGGKFENRGIGAVAVRKLGRIGPDPIPAIPAPHDQSDTSRSCVAEPHRRAGRGFHCLYGYALGEWSPATSADATELLAIKLTSNVVKLTINFLENFMYRWKSPNILSYWLRLLRS